MKSIFERKEIFNTNPLVVIFLFLLIVTSALVYLDLKKDISNFRVNVLEQVFASDVD